MFYLWHFGPRGSFYVAFCYSSIYNSIYSIIMRGLALSNGSYTLDYRRHFIHVLHSERQQNLSEIPYLYYVQTCREGVLTFILLKI